MASLRCERPDCGFLRHSDYSNNGGTHCCHACKSTPIGYPAQHGPACQRRPAGYPGGGGFPGGGFPGGGFPGGDRCVHPHCRYIRHPDFSNNGGTHCCAVCKSSPVGYPSSHGPACLHVMAGGGPHHPHPGGHHPHPGGGHHPHPGGGGGWHHFVVTRALYGTESCSRDVTHILQVRCLRVCSARSSGIPTCSLLTRSPVFRRAATAGASTWITRPWGCVGGGTRTCRLGCRRCTPPHLLLLPCRGTPSSACASTSR